MKQKQLDDNSLNKKKTRNSEVDAKKKFPKSREKFRKKKCIIVTFKLREDALGHFQAHL